MSSVMTPIGILSFPNLFVPKPPAEGADPRYSINLILDRAAQATPEYANLRRAVSEALEERWGAGKSRDPEFLRKKKIGLPFRPCSDRDYAGYDVEGGVFIAPWSKNKPGLVDPRRQDIDAPSDVWSGQKCRCTVHAFSYDVSGNAGVAFNLNNVQIVRFDMPRLDGRKAARDEFGEWDDEELPGNPRGRAMVDDEIPF